MYHCQGTYADWCPQLGNAARVSPDHFDYWTSTSHHGTGDLINTLTTASSHSGLQPDGGTYWSDWDLMVRVEKRAVHGVKAQKKFDGVY